MHWLCCRVGLLNERSQSCVCKATPLGLRVLVAVSARAQRQTIFLSLCCGTRASLHTLCVSDACVICVSVLLCVSSGVCVNLCFINSSAPLLCIGEFFLLFVVLSCSVLVLICVRWLRFIFVVSLLKRICGEYVQDEILSSEASHKCTHFHIRYRRDKRYTRVKERE